MPPFGEECILRIVATDSFERAIQSRRVRAQVQRLVFCRTTLKVLARFVLYTFASALHGALALAGVGNRDSLSHRRSTAGSLGGGSRPHFLCCRKIAVDQRMRGATKAPIGHASPVRLACLRQKSRRPAGLQEQGGSLVPVPGVGQVSALNAVVVSRRNTTRTVSRLILVAAATVRNIQRQLAGERVVVP